MFTSYHYETIARQRMEETARQARTSHLRQQIKTRTGWHVPDLDLGGVHLGVRTTSSMRRRPATSAVVVVVVATALTAALATGAHEAYASPEAGGHATVPVATVHPFGDHVERPCFIEPQSWNEALDGPLPRCRTYLR